MRLWIFSDLHLDVNARFPFTLPEPFPEHDVVVIAGDVCESMAQGVRWIVASGLDEKPVIYVAGNHEFYHLDRHEDLAAARAYAAPYPNIHILDGDRFDVGGKTFLGATLWTDYDLAGDRDGAIDLAQRTMSDHTIIRCGRLKWTATDARNEHVTRTAWLESELSRARRADSIVVTHHGPHPRSCSTKFRGHPLNPSFVSDLSPLLAKTGTWIHGHTHMAVDYRHEGCRVINNPRGYVRSEMTGFLEGLVVEV